MKLSNTLKAKISNDVISRLTIKNNKSQLSNIHIMDELIPKGKIMTIGQSKLEIKSNSAFVFADHDPAQNWSHDCEYIFYDEQGNLTQKVAAKFPPLEMLQQPQIFTAIQTPVKLKPYKEINPAVFQLFEGGILQSVLSNTINRYAILYSGMSNNRHVNDMEFLYRTLIDLYHFKPENILVANHDGTVNYFGDPQPVVKWPGNNTAYRMKVWTKGDTAGLNKAIDEISKRIGANDFLLIHTNNHGGHDGVQSNLCTYPDWAGYTASDFAAKLKKMPRFSKLMVMMEQCHSGGFINPILNNSPATYTHVAAACKESDSSAGGANFDPFALDWICGVTGRNASGGALSGTVDGNKDFNISAAEVFKYAHDVNTAGDTSVAGDKPLSCGNNIYLNNGDTSVLMAWKGMNNDQTLWYSLYDGASWAPQRQVPNVASSVGPSLARYKGKIYMAWKGMNTDQGIWFTSYDGNSWAAQKNVAGVATSYKPVLAVFNNKLYMAWKGMNNDQTIWWSSFDGNSWTPQQQVPGVFTSVGPSLAVFNGKLYMAWKGMNNDQTIWWSCFDGNSWKPQQQVPGVFTSVGPSLAEFNGKLYMAWKGMNADQGIWYTYFNGNSWAPQKQVPGVATSVGPALVVSSNRLYMSWKGMNSDQGIWFAAFDGNNWSAQSNVGGVATSVGTAMATV